MTNFVKRNWAVILLVIIGLLYLKNNFLGTSRVMTSGSKISLSPMADMEYAPLMSTGGGVASISNTLFPGRQVAPSEDPNRIVIQDTSLSLQVKDVAKVINEIEVTAKGLGGFLVNSNLSKPQGAANGTIVVRVPEDKRKEAMEMFKGMAVKVVSESVNGTDVTDQYTDLQARLEVLLKTKMKYEDILERAVTVSDLMNVQQQLISLQSQIDSLKGQQKYYEQSAKLSKIAVYLSTDDLALPYAPTNEWRPLVVFKQAIRSLIGSLRDLGSILIWVVVYSPIIIPAILIVRYIKRRKSHLKG